MTHVNDLYVGTADSQVQAVDSSGNLFQAGTQVNATAAEINRVCDVSARIVTIVATGSITAAANEGNTNLLGEVGGNALVTLTLPEATGSGAIYNFIVSVVNTSNYVITTADATNASYYGIITLLDEDLTAPVCYSPASTDELITLNGTTSGGQIGDWLQLVDIATDQWAVKGQLTCPAGSNVATPFSGV